MRYGVLLLRAQPVHMGHISVIKQAIKESDKVLVIIGSANKSRTKRNPIHIDMRVPMVERALNDYGLRNSVEIMTLADWSKEDAYQYAKEWGSFLYYNIVNVIKEKTFAIYYNDDPSIIKNWFIPEIANRIDVRSVTRSDDGISSTKIREAVLRDTPEDDAYLKASLAPSTYEIKSVLKRVFSNCSAEDFIMN